MENYTPNHWYSGLAGRINPLNIFRHDHSNLEARVEAAPAGNNNLVSRLRYGLVAASVVGVMTVAAACGSGDDKSTPIPTYEPLMPTATATATAVPATPTPPPIPTPDLEMQYYNIGRYGSVGEVRGLAKSIIDEAKIIYDNVAKYGVEKYDAEKMKQLRELTGLLAYGVVEDHNDMLAKSIALLEVFVANSHDIQIEEISEDDRQRIINSAESMIEWALEIKEGRNAFGWDYWQRSWESFMEDSMVIRNMENHPSK